MLKKNNPLAVFVEGDLGLSQGQMKPLGDGSFNYQWPTQCPEKCVTTKFSCPHDSPSSERGNVKRPCEKLKTLLKSKQGSNN